MNKHLWLTKLWCLGLVCAVSAPAADATKMSGSFEGGYTNSWTSSGGLKGSQFLVDSLNLGKSYDVTDKTKVVVDTMFSVVPRFGTAGGIAGTINSTNYMPQNAQLAVGGFSMGLTNAYLSHQCSDNVNVAVGQMRVPFGMESTMSRYDLHTYYYSRGHALANTYNWDYDLGLRASVANFGGDWHFAILDGRTIAANTKLTPALAVNWSYEWKNGDMTLTPMISGYFGAWSGMPKDLGLTAGAALKSGMIFANLEWIMASQNAQTAGTAVFAPVAEKDMNIYLEPGVDLGSIQLSAKMEWMNNKAGGAAAATTSTSGWGMGAAISHEYADKYRVKVAYNHSDLSGNFNGHSNDIRLLFGTKW